MFAGTCYYSNNLVYVGEFKKNLKDGFGNLYYSNGNTMYKGFFKNDKFLTGMVNYIYLMETYMKMNLKIIGW